MATYIVLIRKQADSAYGVDFPDFPVLPLQVVVTASFRGR